MIQINTDTLKIFIGRLVLSETFYYFLVLY